MTAARVATSIADRVRIANEDWEGFVEADVAGEAYDFDAAIATCQILGKSLDSIGIEAAKRRSWRQRCDEFHRIMDERRVAAARDEIHAAQAGVDAVRAKIEELGLKAALDRHARAVAALAALNKERQVATTEFSDVRRSIPS